MAQKPKLCSVNLLSAFIVTSLRVQLYAVKLWVTVKSATTSQLRNPERRIRKETLGDHGIESVQG